MMRLLSLALLFVITTSAQGSQDSSEVMDEVHFLIPAGPGGGWDGTARGVGEAMLKSGLVSNVSFENLSGGGGVPNQQTVFFRFCQSFFG